MQKTPRMLGEIKPCLKENDWRSEEFLVGETWDYEHYFYLFEGYHWEDHLDLFNVTRRVRLRSNFNSTQRVVFQEQRYQRRIVERAALHRVSSCRQGIPADCASGRCLDVILLRCRPRVEPDLVCFSNRLPGDLIQWPLRSFPSLRLWSLTNRCAFSPMQTPFPLISRCGPVATSYKNKALGNFPNEAKVPHEQHVVTFPPQRSWRE